MKIIGIFIGLMISVMVAADDYPCSKNGIEQAVGKKISLGQTKSDALESLGGEVIQDHKYQNSPLEDYLNGKKIRVWGFTKISAMQCRSIRSLFFIKSNFVITLFFDNENILLASEVTGYHDSL